MSTEQAVLPKGTRVEITDLTHDYPHATGQITGEMSGGQHLVLVDVQRPAFALHDQIRVIPQPEPTIGQLVDAMHEAAKASGHNVVRIDLDEGYGEGDYRYGRVAVWTKASGMNPYYSHGPTPQAALRAMIERLNEIK